MAALLLDGSAFDRPHPYPGRNIGVLAHLTRPPSASFDLSPSCSIPQASGECSDCRPCEARDSSWMVGYLNCPQPALFSSRHSGQVRWLHSSRMVWFFGRPNPISEPEFSSPAHLTCPHPILRCPAYLTLSPVTQANRTQTPTVKGPEPIGRLQLLL